EPRWHGGILEIAREQRHAGASGPQLLGELLHVGVLSEDTLVIGAVEVQRQVVAVGGEAASDRGGDPAATSDAGEQRGAGKRGGCMHGADGRATPARRPAISLARPPQPLSSGRSHTT